MLRNKTRIHLEADKIEKALLSIIIYFTRDNTTELKLHKKMKPSSKMAVIYGWNSRRIVFAGYSFCFHSSLAKTEMET